MNDPIDRQAAIELIERMKSYHQDADDIAEMIANMPSAQPEIIRCKDCLIHGICRLEQWLGLDGYCSRAERRTDETTI